jgi:hypothetical protein
VRFFRRGVGWAGHDPAVEAFRRELRGWLREADAAVAEYEEWEAMRERTRAQREAWWELHGSEVYAEVSRRAAAAESVEERQVVIRELMGLWEADTPRWPSGWVDG